MTYLQYRVFETPASPSSLDLGPVGRALVPEGFTPPAEPFDVWEFFRLREAERPPGGLLREFFHHGILHAR